MNFEILIKKYLQLKYFLYIYIERNEERQYSKLFCLILGKQNKVSCKKITCESEQQTFYFNSILGLRSKSDSCKHMEANVWKAIQQINLSIIFVK